jgi:uncharacterized protein (TIGR00725 family)
MGSGQDPHSDRAGPLGSRLAEFGVHLLTGGGGGVMASVSAAFHAGSPRRGLVIGVLPTTQQNDSEPAERSGYPNSWVEIPIRTHLPYSGLRGQDPLSRNHINVLSADVIVALPGGAGTASEVALAVRYERPVIVWADPLQLDVPNGVAHAAGLDDVMDFVARHTRVAAPEGAE